MSAQALKYWDNHFTAKHPNKNKPGKIIKSNRPLNPGTFERNSIHLSPILTISLRENIAITSIAIDVIISAAKKYAFLEVIRIKVGYSVKKQDF